MRDWRGDQYLAATMQAQTLSDTSGFSRNTLGRSHHKLAVPDGAGRQEGYPGSLRPVDQRVLHFLALFVQHAWWHRENEVTRFQLPLHPVSELSRSYPARNYRNRVHLALSTIDAS